MKLYNIVKIITRIVALPAFIILHSILMIRSLIYTMVKWLIYGGKSIIYERNHECIIVDVWNKLNKKNNDTKRKSKRIN